MAIFGGLLNYRSEQDRGQPRTNTFHHPEKLLRGEDDDSDDDEP
ncbi:hypothetical protein [Mycobacterium malmoense]|nr:hypothetical protein [Mycobacterium malmoense]